MTLKIAGLQMNMVVGDLEGNGEQIMRHAHLCYEKGARLVVTGEMAFTGYPCEDMLLHPSFIHHVRDSLLSLAGRMPSSMALLVGAPWLHEDKLYNAALLFEGGQLRGFVFKGDLPNHGVFDERRLFAQGGKNDCLQLDDATIGVMICEDLWSSDEAQHLQKQQAHVLVSMNASPYETNKHEMRLAHAKQRVLETNLPLMYVNQWGGQDELVFDGASFILSSEAQTVWQGASWRDEIAWMPHSSQGTVQEHRDDLDYRALMTGLRDYVLKSGHENVLLGVSGGLDSAMTACLAVDALGKDKVCAIILPSHVTSAQTMKDAKKVAATLHIQSRVLSITDAMDSCLAELQSLSETSLTVQNLQARLRGILLMALSNETGALLLATSNKSEGAVGYSTLYGDMNGAFAPLKDVYKTRVRALALYRNRHVPEGAKGGAGMVIPQEILDKPPSAELIPNQKDEEELMPYAQLDKILYFLLEDNLSVAALVQKGISQEDALRVRHLLLRAEYKRRQAPPGIKISACHFGRDRRYPIINGGEKFL